MAVFDLFDSCISEIAVNHYDLAVFSCGYEARSTALSKHLELKKINHLLVMYFSQEIQCLSRIDNQKYFGALVHDSLQMSYDEDQPIYDYLNKKFSAGGGKEIKILVDYSSMSRLWYVSILNWARYVEFAKISIDFVYSVAEYEGVHTPLVIKQVLALPGHEGVTSYPTTVSVFGLGYDSLTTLCVFDKLEPSIVHSYIAMSFFDDYESTTAQYNREFIEQYSESVQYFPFDSVFNTFRLMGELISPYKGEYNITFIPMGPKPHVLAAVLLSLQNREIINLYVKGRRKVPMNAIHNGKYICTGVRFDSPNPHLI